MKISWEVLWDEDFALWFYEQTHSFQDELLAHAELLSVFGPSLGRPRVDSIQGSKVHNLKELRIQHKGDPWRILFAFDSKRRSVFLVGGNKRGDKRWYEKNIPVAEVRFTKHLKTMEKEDGKKH